MKTLLSLLLSLLSLAAFSQVVTTRPAVPLETSEVTIVFHADEGTKGLMDFTGDVYAHTGVITSESTGGTDWKYTVADWGVNVPKAKMTRVSANTYELTITPDVRTFYGVPSGEEILKMAFVFRSATQIDGAWKEGKDTGGKDIFVTVYQAGLTAVLSSPADGALFNPGETVVAQGLSANADEMVLWLNGTQVASTTESELTHSFTAPATGNHELILQASAGGEVEADTVHFFIREPAVEESVPTGLRKGVNVLNNQSVTLVLQAPDKGYVYVLGDFNNWQPRPEAQMKKDGEYFWLTLSDLEPGTEYAYQYYIDGELRVADPYTNKVLDPWNDKYIPDRIYPNLKAYPAGKTDGIVSVFTTTPDEYQWNSGEFTPPPPEKMVVYEVLIRDFTANQDIKTITDTLSYLKRLGVNAIELMPFNEFEGNDSWGYNPSFYFATDKAYGTLNDYKEFVDSCHSKGIAVIMDMVLNHSYGQSPLVQMYFEDGKPAANNPWYNREHNMQNPDAQWGYDFNHESPYTRALVDSINAYWMSELRVDGFRFDFTKGFTNTPYPPGSWASDYDASRIAILTRMATEIRKRNPQSVVIFEHLSENSEERELSQQDILLWGNMNGSFSEAVMGYNQDNKSDFSWASYEKRGWEKPHVLAYMESHDEERVMYRALNYGNSSGSYNVKEPVNSSLRSAMAAVFLMAIPGPKMIWQFGELGYDISIDQGGRLGQKPPKWEYLQQPEREAMWLFYADIIRLKKTEEVFSTTDFQLDVAGVLKKITLNSEDADVRLIGNFGVTQGTIVPGFSKSGWWYNHFQGDSIQVTDPGMAVVLNPGEFALFTSQKMEGYRNLTSTGPGVKESSRVQIFPNPANDILNVESEEPVASILLYNLSGKKMLQQNKKGASGINVAHLPNGVYIMQLIFDNGESVFRKVIVSK